MRFRNGKKSASISVEYALGLSAAVLVLFVMLGIVFNNFDSLAGKTGLNNLKNANETKKTDYVKYNRDYSSSVVGIESAGVNALTAVHSFPSLGFSYTLADILGEAGLTDNYTKNRSLIDAVDSVGSPRWSSDMSAWVYNVVRSNDFEFAGAATTEKLKQPLKSRATTQEAQSAINSANGYARRAAFLKTFYGVNDIDATNNKNDYSDSAFGNFEKKKLDFESIEGGTGKNYLETDKIYQEGQQKMKAFDSLSVHKYKGIYDGSNPTPKEAINVNINYKPYIDAYTSSFDQYLNQNYP